jgi:hypothetical protein
VDFEKHYPNISHHVKWIKKSCPKGLNPNQTVELYVQLFPARLARLIYELMAYLGELSQSKVEVQIFHLHEPPELEEKKESCN